MMYSWPSGSMGSASMDSTNHGQKYSHIHTHTQNSRKVQKAELEFVEPTIIYIVFRTIYIVFTLN